MRLTGQPESTCSWYVPISSFGEGEAGELYLLDLNGRVFHLVASTNLKP